MTDSDQNDPSEPQTLDLTAESQLESENAENVVLSQKQRRAVLKRERRKRKRQALAKIRETCQLSVSAADQSQHEESNAEDQEEELDEEQRKQMHEEWMEREKIAQEEFRLKREREEAIQKKKEEEERRIREEWEEQQRKEKEEQEQKEQEKREREEAVQKMLDQAESQLENGGPWKNPDAPKDYGTEKDKANCPFFLKTGACRFGDRCSRKHDHPTSSTTLMVRGMFVTFGMEQSRRDDYDTDSSLEYSEEELQQQFLDFYDDVLPEFKSAGKVVQFKVSCNFEPHLRGNVYVQYETEEQCKEAFMMFNGRWYAGKQLQCEFSPVTRWKTAICGLFDRQRCPKGKHCNFLHVFRNPGNDFWEADRDLHLSPDRTGGFSSRRLGARDGMWSQRGDSPERSQRRWTDRRSHSRERYSHRGGRGYSRERWGRSRERWGHNRERQSRSRERHNRNRDRQSRSRSRERRRTRSQREQSRRSRSRSQSRDKDRLEQDECTSGDSRRKRRKLDDSEHVPKNGSVKRTSHSRKSKSPEDPDKTDSATPHHRKHSKKSKKKKKGKKKHKRKKSKSRSQSSSAESDEDSGNEEGDVTPSQSEKVVVEVVESSICPPEDKVQTQALECSNQEEDTHFSLTDSSRFENTTESA